jgi:fibronectin type 3 domain-containing protein
MPVVPLPAAPTALSAVAGNQQLGLTWTASADATSYHVKRATISGGPYVQVGSTAVTSYTDTGLTNGTKYFYVVSALNASGESPNSSQASGTPVAPAPGVPVVPTALTATAANQQITLSWTASSGATSYHVKRATVSGGPYSQVSAPTSNGYLNTGLANGTTYYYVVSALNASG